MPDDFDLAALGLSLLNADMSEERAAQIERLRKLVKSGEYKVDAEALARKLMEKHPDFQFPEDDAK